MSNTELARYLEQHVPQETYAVLEAIRNWPSPLPIWREKG
jgi:hypothetical protein